MPSVSRLKRKEIINICKDTGCELKIVPGIYQMLNGEVSVSKLRNVEIEDLLGRDPICVEMQEIYEHLQGKTILVTGGGGSIGSELCRQIAAHHPKKLIIFDVYENNAYEIQQELKAAYPKLQLETIIGSVRDSRKIFQVFELYRPEIVYHAAAHKHVPLMEASPCEAIKNNVIGTYKTAYAAMTHGCRRFVLISTDKAVNPTNIMGASKRLCEMIVQAFDEKIKQGKAEEIPQLFTHLMKGLGIVAVETQAAGVTTIVSDGFPDDVMVTHKIQKIKLDTDLWADSAISLIGHRETETDNAKLNEKFNSKRIAFKVKERYLSVQNK